MIQHRPDDMLTAVCGPRRFGANPQALTPGGKAEALKAEDGLEFGRVFPASLVAGCIFGKCARGQPELPGQEGNQRFGRVLAWPQALTGVTQQAELDGEAKPIRRAAFGSDERQVLGAEYVMTCHFGAIDGDGEQAIALLGGEKSSSGQDGLVAEGEDRS
jgi:hypothetical protein